MGLPRALARAKKAIMGERPELRQISDAGRCKFCGMELAVGLPDGPIATNLVGVSLLAITAVHPTHLSRLEIYREQAHSYRLLAMFRKTFRSPQEPVNDRSHPARLDS
jgi:hypothetical protein